MADKESTNSKLNMESNFVGLIGNWVKKWLWYTILLVASSIYVFQYPFESYSLDPLNAQSLVFILWLLLLFWPLISEMEFLGVKVKKEVEKSTKEVKETTREVKASVDKLQAEIFQLQLSNNIANSVNVQNNYGAMPTAQQMKESRILEIFVISFNMKKINNLPLQG